MMKKTLIATVMISALVTTPFTSYANEAENNDELAPERVEEIGFGTGALIGAIFGGPAGAFITGMAGTFLAKNLNAHDEIDDLKLTNQQQSANHQEQLAKLQNQLQLSEQEYQQELLALEQKQISASKLQAENLLMSLQFRTGSSDIPQHYQGQLSALASLLKQSDDVNIDLSGYTDLLGSKDINLKLSKERAESVKNALVKLGVTSDRIQTFGFGDSAPIVANAQQKSSFYDRRVMIKLRQQPSQVAKNF